MNKFNKINVIAILFMLFLSSCGNNNHPILDSDRDIKIYYINDTHGAFKRQNTETNYNEAGMAYISQYLKEKKNSDPLNTLIISGGDMFQGGFESNATFGEIMVDAMNEIGFDAMVLGNHEFDWGEDKLIYIADKLDCPIISCNTFYRDTGEMPAYIEPYVVIEKNNLKIGVIGAASKDMNTSITGSISSNFSFPDPTSYIKTYSRTLRNEKGCDLVVAAFHDGGFDGNNFKFKSLCDVDLSTNKQYVDGIFLAHDHRKKDGYYLDVPYIESGCNGRYVGYMDLQMEYKNDQYHLINGYVENISAYSTCKYEDAEINKLLTKYENEISIGNEVLYTFKKDYSRDDFAYLICEAMYWYVNENKDYFGGHQIYLTTHNFGGVRVAVSKGDMTYSQLISTIPFDNNIYIEKCNASNVEYINRQSAYYAIYAPSSIIYDNGYTYAATISYIAENENYGQYLHVEATEYQITAKQIFIEFLRNKVNPNL